VEGPEEAVSVVEMWLFLPSGEVVGAGDGFSGKM